MRPDWYDLKTHVMSADVPKVESQSSVKAVCGNLLGRPYPVRPDRLARQDLRDVLTYLAYRQPDRPIILLDPSSHDSLPRGTRLP